MWVPNFFRNFSQKSLVDMRQEVLRGNADGIRSAGYTFLP